MDHTTPASIQPPTATRPTPSQIRQQRRRRSKARRRAEAEAARALGASGATPPGPGDDALAGFPPLVRLLACRREAVVAVEDLAREVGRDVEDLWEEVLELDRRGDVAAWPDHPRGPVVALSSRSAAALGLRLTPNGTRWMGLGPAGSKSGKRRRKARVAAGQTGPVAAAPAVEDSPGFGSLVTIVVAAGA